MASLVGFIFSAALAVCVVAGGFLFKAKNDNIVEQVAEHIIKHQTGIDIDLSPEVEEPKK